MNCEEISQKAIELKIKPKDIKISKEPYNGWRIDAIKKTNKIKKLIDYVTKPKRRFKKNRKDFNKHEKAKD